MNEILDAQDKIATARNLNDAVLMAISNHAMDAKKTSALQALSLIIDDTLIQARDVLEAYQREQPKDQPANPIRLANRQRQSNNEYKASRIAPPKHVVSSAI